MTDTVNHPTHHKLPTKTIRIGIQSPFLTFWCEMLRGDHPVQVRYDRALAVLREHVLKYHKEGK